VKQWDHCTICLNVVEDGVVCPSGDLFCKRCVYEYIMSQKKVNRKLLRAWEDQKNQKAKNVEEKLNMKLIEKFLEFERLDSGFVTNTEIKKQRNPIMLQGDDVGMEVRTDRQSVFQEKDNVKCNAYWVPQNLPSHTNAVKRPTMQVLCPGCCNELKVKMLFEVRFTKVKIDSDAPKFRFMCPNCRKGLSNSSKVCVLSKCAHGLCLYCIKHFVSKERQCPICEKRCKKRHVIPLQVGGTGFAGSGAKYVTKEFRPANQG